jgi:hypothetical protein
VSRPVSPDGVRKPISVVTSSNIGRFPILLSSVPTVDASTVAPMLGSFEEGDFETVVLVRKIEVSLRGELC